MLGFMPQTLVRVAVFSAAALLLQVGCALAAGAQHGDSGHPNLTVTRADIATIVEHIADVPRAKLALDELALRVEQAIAAPIEVPMPKDAGGGYTHERHKQNYRLLYDAGLLFQITKDDKYLDYSRNVLLAYAELYPTLGIHPKPKEQAPGKLFWQSLNEAMWLVHVIQAYDMLAGSLSASERTLIEQNLLRPVANFLSAGQPETFNKIHNHGTWAAAAVGMTGYVLNDETLVKQALYGLDLSGEGGFLKQIEHLFSPDGYYAEGPYYQRFALLPFVLFGKAIEVNQPEIKIFEYRDGVLLKAITTAVQLSYNRLFFGINDAIKDKGIDTIELVHGVAIAYGVTKDPSLLAVAQLQNQTLLTGYGFAVAEAIAQNRAQPFQYKSLQLRDGKDGDQGALTIFRNGVEFGHQALVMKNTSQGLGHGHFDKLHWLYFDNGREIISDYGAARFLNIEAKYGGHYLPENNAWAKQTIAHNTVVVDEQSQFGGNWELSQQFAPEILFFSADAKTKITTATIDSAYDGTELTRTLAMVNIAGLEHPLIFDLFKVASKTAQQYDLPLHYQGQIISHNLALKPNVKRLTVLGKNNGYQYLWDRGRAAPNPALSQLTWLNADRFYTYSVANAKGQEMIFAQLGANDPNFNLRNESSFITRVKAKPGHTFVSVLETHGEYNGRAEYTRNAKSKVVALTSISAQATTVVTVALVDGRTIRLAVAYHGDESTVHKVELGGETLEWVGHFKLIEDSQSETE